MPPLGTRWKAFARLLNKPLEKVAKPQGWAEVAVVPDLFSAGMLESALRSEGIPVMVQKPPFFSYTGSGGFHGVLVPAGMEAEARSLLECMRDPEEDAEDRGEEE